MNVSEGESTTTSVSHPTPAATSTSVSTQSTSTAQTSSATLQSTSSASETTSTQVVRPKDPSRPQLTVERIVAPVIEWIRPPEFDLDSSLFWVSQ